METITIGDTVYKLWRKAPQWRLGLGMEHAMQTIVAKGESGRPTRYSWIEAMRSRMSPLYQLQRGEVKLLDELLLEPDHLVWAVPVWVALALASRGLHGVIYRAAYTLNFDDDGFVVFAEHEVPEVVPYKWLVPLMFASLSRRPDLTPKGGKLGIVRMGFEEDCRFDLRLRINEVELPQNDVWPEVLRPTYQQNLELSDDQLDLTELGRYRQKLRDGEEAAPVFGQEAQFNLNDPRDKAIRTLLTFWKKRGARLKSFSQPVWFVPPEGYGAQGVTEAGASVVNNPIVGFASDKLKLDYRTNGHATTTLRFFQRPTEENGGIDGDDPVQGMSAYLLEFEYRIPTPIRCRFAAYEKDLQWDGNVFAAAPFEVSNPEWSYALDRSVVTIKSWRFDGNPLNKLIPFELEAKLMLTIWECDPADVGGTAQVYWAGELVSAATADKQITAKCVVFGPDMDIKLPRNIRQPGCPHCVFDRNCRANQGTYRRSATITAITGADITISGIADYSGWLTRGRLITGHGDRFETRPIEGHEGNTLNIVKPLRYATIGQAVTLWPGCDGEWATCQSKFDNGVNFGGRPHAVNTNPTIQADDPVQEAAKK